MVLTIVVLTVVVLTIVVLTIVVLTIVVLTIVVLTVVVQQNKYSVVGGKVIPTSKLCSDSIESGAYQL